MIIIHGVAISSGRRSRSVAPAPIEWFLELLESPRCVRSPLARVTRRGRRMFARKPARPSGDLPRRDGDRVAGESTGAARTACLLGGSNRGGFETLVAFVLAGDSGGGRIDGPIRDLLAGRRTSRHASDRGAVACRACRSVIMRTASRTQVSAFERLRDLPALFRGGDLTRACGARQK